MAFRKSRRGGRSRVWELFGFCMARLPVLQVMGSSRASLGPGRMHKGRQMRAAGGYLLHNLTIPRPVFAPCRSHMFATGSSGDFERQVFFEDVHSQRRADHRRRRSRGMVRQAHRHAERPPQGGNGGQVHFLFRGRIGADAVQEANGSGRSPRESPPRRGRLLPASPCRSRRSAACPAGPTGRGAAGSSLRPSRPSVPARPGRKGTGRCRFRRAC